MQTTPHRKIRVLVDLSVALRGYCGIAQDVRLLYKGLASCPQVEVTGLVYQPHRFGPLTRFAPADAPLAERLDRQARFLWAMAAGSVDWPSFRPLRVWRRLRQMWALATTSRARLDPVDMETFWPVVWRLLFAPTLCAEDIPLIRRGRFLLSNLSDGMVHGRILTRRRPVRLDTAGYDFLIVQGPRPLRTSAGTRQIVRYHDMIPLRDPDTMVHPLVIRAHHNGIRQCRKRAFFACNSEPTRQDLAGAYPELGPHCETVPNMLGEIGPIDAGPELIRSIIEMRRSTASGARPAPLSGDELRYIMCVSTLEPRKNFVGLLQAFNSVRFREPVRRAAPNLKLLVVGSPGWKYEPILAAMRGLVAAGDVIHLERVASDELRALYSRARAFVFPSFAEGFGFPPLEAMQCGTPVIASDIPAHRAVMGDAALYCDPYDVQAIAAAIERLLAAEESPGLRAELVARGRERVKLYSQERCVAQWVGLLERLKYGWVVDGNRAAGESAESTTLRNAA
jgi:glycosyltransferase involved in cell wall biosynthesis